MKDGTDRRGDRTGGAADPLVEWRLRRAEALLRARIETGVAVEEVARAVGLSPAYFSRAFKASTGLAPIQWLTGRRCQRARELLADPEIPLSQVALATGFCDQAHFTRTFARLIGQSPGAWRRKNVESPASP